MAHVLVVDDDAEVRKLLAWMLTDAGHEVQTARDGLEAIDCLLISPHPWVVLLDVMMPRMSGEAVVRLVAEGAPELTRHAFILVSAIASSLPPDLLQLLRWLDIPVIGKPFEIDTLIDAVETAAASSFVPVHAGEVTARPGSW
jgi:CheY-like chemotaxis protein